MNPVTGLQRAKELQTEVQALLLAAAVAGVEVLIDALLIPSALRGAGAAVVITPPKQSYPNYTRVTNEWQIWVIAGTPQDQLAAWETIDAVLAALKDPLSIEEAEPDSYDALNGPAYPAYRMQFTETI